MTELDKPKSSSSPSAHPPPQSQPLPPPQYGTFQGVSNFPPPHPAIGFPQPVPPPGSDPSAPPYYPHGYQAYPGYVVAEGRPVRERRLGCCGIGCGWCLVDYREKPGYIACIVAAVVATVAIVLGATNLANEW